MTKATGNIYGISGGLAPLKVVDFLGTSASFSHCSSGYTAPVGENCSPCEAGTFKAVSGAGPCTKCPSNSSSVSGSISLSNCTCNSGFTGPDGGICSACEAGTFKEVSGAAPCTQCAAGTYSAQLGAASRSTCLECPSNASSFLGSTSVSNCTCNSGFTDHSETIGNFSGIVNCSATGFSLELIEGLESLGAVKVFAKKTFPVPNRSKTDTFGLEGEFSAVTIAFPPGAWPANVTAGPSIAVFEIPPAARRGAAVVAGKGVNFGPDGIAFSIPVAISCPVDSGFNVIDRTLRIQKYIPRTNTTAAAWGPPLDIPDDGASSKGWKRDSAGKLTAVSALTTSFSPYAVVAHTSAGTSASNTPTPPQSTPQSTPNKATVVNLPPEDSKNEVSLGWIIGLSIFAAILLIAAFAGLFLQLRRKSKKPLLPPDVPSNVLNTHPDVESQPDCQDPDVVSGDDRQVKCPYPLSRDHQGAGSASDVAVSVSGDLVVVGWDERSRRVPTDRSTGASSTEPEDSATTALSYSATGFKYDSAILQRYRFQTYSATGFHPAGRQRTLVMPRPNLEDAGFSTRRPST